MINIYSFYIATLGCRVNQYESEVISQILCDRGLYECNVFDSNCDLFIINTCAVTSEATRKARQLIRSAHSKNKKAKILITGCYSQLSPEDLSNMDGVSFVCGSGNKTQVCDFAIKLLNGDEIPQINISNMDTFDNDTRSKSIRVREYLKVEDGCNCKCSYCIISTARGKVRSKDIETAIKEAKQLSNTGAKEIIITGVEISEYQFDLISLLQGISKIKEIKRIRLGSLNPNLLTEEFCRRLSKINKIMPYFHISLQSGSSTVLARMKRRYNAEMASKSINNLKKYFPSSTLSCDIIVGFPGETDEEFNETVQFVKDVRFLHCHIFPYSIRKGTLASTMDNQIPKEIKTNRLKLLSNETEIIKEGIIKNIRESNRTLSVLVEQYKNGYNIGHTEEFIECKIKDSIDRTGSVIDIDSNKI